MDKHQLTDFKKPYFSLIIPIYSSGIDIRPCLHSCIHQSFEDIEILLIDDCGNPDSVKIAEEMAQKDSRISIFYNSENRGTFQARLTGMQHARGEYILFVDDDDEIELHACERIFEAIEKGEYLLEAQQGSKLKRNEKSKRPEILVFGIQDCAWDPVLYKVPEGEKALKKLYGASICARAYSRAIITQSLELIEHYFPSLPRLILHEDTLMCFIFLYCTHFFQIIPDVLYLYRRNPNSITRIKDDKIKISKTRHSAKVVELFEQFKNFPQKQDGGTFNAFQSSTIQGLKQLTKMYRSYRIFKWFSKEGTICAHLLAYYMSNRYLPSWKNYVKALIYCLSLGHIKR